VAGNQDNVSSKRGYFSPWACRKPHQCLTNQRIRRWRQARLVQGTSRAILNADHFNVSHSMRPIAIVLNGTSSSGKTSIAKAIQRIAGEPVIHASLDSFTDMFDWPSISDPHLAHTCHAAGVANFHAALPILAQGTIPIVVDHVFELREWYAACTAALSARTIYLVGVRCKIEVLEACEAARGDRRIGMARFQLDRVHEQINYSLEVDTSACSSQECARTIWRHIQRPEVANQSTDPAP
jgi:chloramphenicol 3-O phosphotransferase